MNGNPKVSPEYANYVKELTNEALCFIFQNAESEEERQGTSAELVERFLPLIKSKASSERYRSQCGAFSQEDIIQEGVTCLLQCAEDYRENLCPVFTTFAEAYITYAINDFYFRVNDVRREHSPKFLRKHKSGIRSMIEYSLDGLEEGDKSTIRLRQHQPTPEEDLIRRDEEERLHEAMERLLTDRELSVITSRYINGNKWAVVAAGAGVSRRTAMYDADHALEKLRVAME